MKPRRIATPLTDDEYETLASALDDNSPFDVEGLLGVLHAVSVAPSLVPPSTWLHVVLPDGMAGLDARGAQEFLGLVMRLYNDVLDGVTSRRPIMPHADDEAGCDAFAAGFVAGAEADPEWTGDDDHWSWTAWAAYLAGKRELVDPTILRQLDGDPDARPTLREKMAFMVLAANETFLTVRRAALGELTPTAPPSTKARVGRNEPCPCGSGKKYKRCCIDGGAAVTH